MKQMINSGKTEGNIGRRSIRVLQPFLVAFCVITLMPPTFLYLSDFYTVCGKYVKLGIALVLYGVFFLDICKRKKTDVFVTAYLIYSSGIVISSLCYGLGLSSAVWTYCIAPGTMLLLVKYSVQSDEDLLLKTLTCISAVYGIGYVLFSFFDIGQAESGYKIWVIARSSFLCYILIGILAFFCYSAKNGILPDSRLTDQKAGKRKRWFVILLILFALELAGAFFAGKSLTTLLSVLMFAVYLPYCMTAKDRFRFPVWLFVILFAVSLLVILFPQSIIEHSFLRTFLSGIGKGTTFSGRTTIWEKAMLLIQKRPVFGYGGVDLNLYLGFENPHNEMLYILIRRGIFGFVLLIVLLCVLFRCVDQKKNVILRNGLIWFVFCLSVGTMFEVPTMMSMVACLSLVYYVSDSIGENIGESHE